MGNIVLPGNAPQFSMLGRPDSDITSINHLKPTKTREPGPGQYTDKDGDFNFLTSKFQYQQTKFGKGNR